MKERTNRRRPLLRSTGIASAAILLLASPGLAQDSGGDANQRNGQNASDDSQSRNQDDWARDERSNPRSGQDGNQNADDQNDDWVVIFYEYVPLPTNTWWMIDTADRSGSSRDEKSGKSNEWSRDSSGKWSSGKSKDSGQRTPMSSGSTALNGTVESFNRVRLDGSDGAHTLVRVRLEDGTSKIVNLGDGADLSDIDVAEGDQIRVKGYNGTIGDKSCIMAQEMQVEGDRVDLQSDSKEGSSARRGSASMARSSDRSGQDRSGRNDQQRDMRQAMLRGEVAEVREVERDGVPDEHLLVRLELEDGTRQIVDLGRAKDLEDFDIEEGSSVTVRGRRPSESGSNRSRVMQASYMKVDDTPFAIHSQYPERNERDARSGSDGRQGSGSKQQSGSNRRSGSNQGSNQGSNDQSRSSDRRNRLFSPSTFVIGRVDSVRKIRMPDARGSSTFARVKLEDGTHEIVDFGPELELSDLEFDEGERIYVRGTERRVGDSKVISAHFLRLDDRNMLIDQEERDLRRASDRTQQRSQQSRDSGRGNSSRDSRRNNGRDESDDERSWDFFGDDDPNSNSKSNDDDEDDGDDWFDF